jgi:hypothetical protein
MNTAEDFQLAAGAIRTATNILGLFKKGAVTCTVCACLVLRARLRLKIDEMLLTEQHLVLTGWAY